MATIRKLKGVLDRDDKDRVLMTLKNLITLCEEDGLYEYPEMNSKIYLHFKGFYRIENLDTFINLKTVYLENNMITSIAGFSQLKQLQHLFLQHNAIKEISGLEENKSLITLNLSHNLISKIEGLSNQTLLENLSIGFNHLSNFDSIVNLKELPALSCCGLEDNQISYDPRILDEIFIQMPHLKVLYLQGNDFSREFPYYRKIMVGSLKELTYLDDRPIFPEERVLSEAFSEGGKEKMQSIIKEINDKKQETRKTEQIQNQKKNAEIKQRRIIFFENNIKKSLIEIETLKKKLNRANLINDPYLISQLQEELKKEENLIIGMEDTLRLMREGQKQMQAASYLSCLQNNKENEKSQIIQLDDENNTKEQHFIQKEDIEKLISSLLLGSTCEEDFEEDNVIQQIETTIKSIYQKIGKNDDFNFKDILGDKEIKEQVQQYKNENPNHLHKLKERRFLSKNLEAVYDYQVNQQMIKEDNNQTQLQEQQAKDNYLDDLE